MPTRITPIEDLAEALRSAYPELAALGQAGADPVYLVGGAVRDLLLGKGRADIDVVVVGDTATLAAALAATTLADNPRFATAKTELDGYPLDIASARTETYAHPGALPEVEPASGIEVDLARRDFTINAMAIPLRGEPVLIDPHGGRADLERGLLRILHPASFVDDPTRAIRAARYASRLGFELESETEALLRATDLGTVSASRRETELLRLAGEDSAARGFALLGEWGLVELREGGADLAQKTSDLLSTSPRNEPHPGLSSPAPWSDEAPRDLAVLAAALGPAGAEQDLAAAKPARPSEAVALAEPRTPVELVLARALGAKWLDEYIGTWRSVALEIDGADLLAAGVPQGPALGRALDATLRRKLDGEFSGRDAELAAALEAAR